MSAPSCLAVLVTALASASPVEATGPRVSEPSSESLSTQKTRDAAIEVPAARPKHRVVVSTDIGGTDFDDFQSLVHLLVYADSLDIEGIISSPYGAGRKEHILQVINYYERDFPNLETYSDQYPTPDALRATSKQGETEVAPHSGVRRATEGSQWMIERARRDDPRPLHVLVWGGIEDLAQALHDAPDILPKLRVYFIGGPNKKWSVDAYHYIATHHRDLWMIEANETYWGWFTGGVQAGDLASDTFVSSSVAGQGALGAFFASGIFFDGQTRTTVKMGDSPSVGWLLHGRPEDPTFPGWGGQFVRAWERPYRVFDRLTTAGDVIEQFGVLELRLSTRIDGIEPPTARMQIENQSLIGFAGPDGSMRFRFSPKEAKSYRYTIHSNVAALDGRVGEITAFKPTPRAASRPAANLPNWWTDDPSPEQAVESRIGARTVSRWREEFLGDFAARLRRCQSPRRPAVEPASTRRVRPPVLANQLLVVGPSFEAGRPLK